MRRLLVLAVLAALSLPGCTSSNPEAETGSASDAVLAGDQPAPQVEPEEIPERGTDPHGEPQVDESPVTVEQRPDGTWTANYTVTVTNGVGDLLRSRTTYGAGSGHVAIVGEERGGYRVVLNVRAEGASEDMARQSLDSASVRHTDQVEDGTLVLSTAVEVAPLLPLPPVPGVPPITLGQPMVSYSFDVQLPQHMAHAVAASASSGAVRVANVHGPSVDADSSSGSVHVEGVEAGAISADASSGSVTVERCVADALTASASSGSVHVEGCTADRLGASASSGRVVLEDVAAAEGDAEASSGQVRVEGAFASLRASTESGSISAELTPAGTGAYAFEASSGSISVDLAAGAYDVEASASSGSVRLDIPDSEEVGEQENDHAHVRSAGFEDAAIQTTVTAEASSGSVNVEADEADG